MADAESFDIRVTADIENASRGFDRLLAMIESTAKQGTEHLGLLDRFVSGFGSNLLQAAANLTPLGRAVGALMETLRAAAGIAENFAKAVGAETEFAALQAAANELGTTVGGMLTEALGSAQSALTQYAAAAVGAQPSSLQLSDVLKTISTNAAEGVRQLQALVETARPLEQRTSTALDVQAANVNAEITARRAEIARLEAAGIKEILDVPTGAVRTLENLRQMTAELERQRDAILAARDARGPSANWNVTVSVQAVADAVEALKRQNRELEIAAATFDMSAGAAARYRAEQQAMAAAGPLWAQRSAEERAELERQLELLERNRNLQAAQERARAADRQAEQRGRQAERLDLGREGQIEALETQIATLGRTAGATAALAFERRELQKLEAAGITITEQERERIRGQADQIEDLTDHLAEARRQLILHQWDERGVGPARPQDGDRPRHAGTASQHHPAAVRRWRRAERRAVRLSAHGPPRHGEARRGWPGDGRGALPRGRARPGAVRAAHGRRHRPQRRRQPDQRHHAHGPHRREWRGEHGADRSRGRHRRLSAGGAGVERAGTGGPAQIPDDGRLGKENDHDG
jgi:hypothetical protein